MCTYGSVGAPGRQRPGATRSEVAFRPKSGRGGVRHQRAGAEAEVPEECRTEACKVTWLRNQHASVDSLP